MNLPFVLTVIAIAFVDSLNPSLFVAQFFLLTTPRPVPRIVAYILGVVAVNFGGGLLILYGLRAAVAEIFNSVDPAAVTAVQFAIGVLLILFGLLYSARPAEAAEAKQPRSLSPIHTFVLGAVVMVNELTTALPYFIAIERILQARLEPLVNIAVLGLYNLVFALPLIGFLGLFMVYGSRFSSQIDRINRWVQVWMPRLIKWGALLFGLWLAAAALQVWLNR